MQVSIPNEEENVSSTPENASGSAEVTKGVKEFKNMLFKAVIQVKVSSNTIMALGHKKKLI